MKILELYERVLPDISKEAILSDDNGVLQRFNEMIAKSKILQKHTNSIWQGAGKDQRWKTTVANNKVIAKNTERELLEYLAEYYDIRDPSNVTLATLYPEWIEYKKYHTRSNNSLGRIDIDWRKYYLGTDVVTTPIGKFTKLYLDEWAHKIIRKHDMTSKQYYNMATIMKQVLTYAVDKEILEANHFLEIKIDTKLFRTQKKPESETQVFLIEELEALKKEAYEDFKKYGYTSALAIILGALTGLRAGEIVAIRECDIGEIYLHIERQEVKLERQKADGSWERYGYEVVEYTKTKAGTRDVYMSKEVRELFKEIKKFNLKNGISDPEHYIFFNRKGERMHECSLDRKIYTLCKRINVRPKSMHKLRKTYISKLIDEGVNINTVREMVGHEDEKVTYKNYCFDRRNKSQIEEQLERILASNQ